MRSVYRTWRARVTNKENIEPEKRDTTMVACQPRSSLRSVPLSRLVPLTSRTMKTLKKKKTPPLFTFLDAVRNLHSPSTRMRGGVLSNEVSNSFGRQLRKPACPRERTQMKVKL